MAYVCLRIPLLLSTFLGAIVEWLGPGPDIRILCWLGDLRQDSHTSMPQFLHLKNERNDVSFLFLRVV